MTSSLYLEEPRPPWPLVEDHDHCGRRADQKIDQEKNYKNRFLNLFYNSTKS